MIQWRKRHSPIGIDIGTRSLKLLQLNGDRTEIIESVRWDRSQTTNADPQLSDHLRAAMHGRQFKGSEVAVGLGSDELFLQNIRVPKSAAKDYTSQIADEITGRLPYDISEAEIRHVEAADVRHGDAMMREIIVLACRRIELHHFLDQIVQAGLRPIAVDVQPLALLRSYMQQCRRDEDRVVRSMYAHIGYGHTIVVIAEGDEILFMKYIAIGGQHMDEAVAHQFELDIVAAGGLRRTNGDRRSENQDPELCTSIAEACRPVLEKLATEVSMCMRYHSVTFRGTPIGRIVLGGGEATPQMSDTLSNSLQQDCHLSNPFRDIAGTPPPGRQPPWDVATGLALREEGQVGV